MLVDRKSPFVISVNMLGKTPCSYRSSSGIVTIRCPPGFKILNQFPIPCPGSPRCSKQCELWTKSNVSSGIANTTVRLQQVSPVL